MYVWGYGILGAGPAVEPGAPENRHRAAPRDPDRAAESTWVKTQRDKIGRILDPLKKPGSAATVMSDTEKWVM